MKRIKLLMLFGALAISRGAFADPPPLEPPSPPPVTTIPNLIGTWKGTLYDARESGYSSMPQLMKITDQQGKLFRGYAQTGAAPLFFFAGTIEDDGVINVVQKDNSGFYSIWHGQILRGASSAASRQISFYVLNPIVPAAHVFTLTKTTP